MALEIAKIPLDVWSLPVAFRRPKLESLYSTVADATLRDCKTLVEDPSSLDIEDIVSLKNIFENAQGLPDGILEKESIFGLIRILILVIENRIDSYQEPLKGQLSQQVNSIKGTIGEVPVLNATLPLPDENFLPTQYIKSSQEWSHTRWDSPSRGSKSETLIFFKKFGEQTSAVRSHLFDYENKKIPRGSDDQVEAYLSYADAECYVKGDLQADHMQPSEQIVARQQELILAMNIDPLFRAQMIIEEAGRGYFTENKTALTGRSDSVAGSAAVSASGVDSIDTVIYGTKKFYLEYHNCISNLWMISTASNTGQGKGSEDALAWLESNPFYGPAFFASIGGKENINKTTIFYTVDVIESDDGAGAAQSRTKMLAELARDWFLKQHSHEIKAARTMKQNISPVLHQETHRIDQNRHDGLPWKHDAALLISKLLLIKGITTYELDGDDEEGIPSSQLASSDIDIDKVDPGILGLTDQASEDVAHLLSAGTFTILQQAIRDPAHSTSTDASSAKPSAPKRPRPGTSSDSE